MPPPTNLAPTPSTVAALEQILSVSPPDLDNLAGVPGPLLFHRLGHHVRAGPDALARQGRPHGLLYKNVPERFISHAWRDSGTRKHFALLLHHTQKYLPGILVATTITFYMFLVWRLHAVVTFGVESGTYNYADVSEETREWARKTATYQTSLADSLRNRAKLTEVPVLQLLQATLDRYESPALKLIDTAAVAAVPYCYTLQWAILLTLFALMMSVGPSLTHWWRRGSEPAYFLDKLSLPQGRSASAHAQRIRGIKLLPYWLARSDEMVICLTDAYMSRLYCISELVAAICLGKRIRPILPDLSSLIWAFAWGCSVMRLWHAMQSFTNFFDDFYQNYWAGRLLQDSIAILTPSDSWSKQFLLESIEVQYMNILFFSHTLQFLMGIYGAHMRANLRDRLMNFRFSDCQITVETERDDVLDGIHMLWRLGKGQFGGEASATVKRADRDQDLAELEEYIHTLARENRIDLGGRTAISWWALMFQYFVFLAGDITMIAYPSASQILSGRSLVDDNWFFLPWLPVNFVGNMTCATHTVVAGGVYASLERRIGFRSLKTWNPFVWVFRLLAGTVALVLHLTSMLIIGGLYNPDIKSTPWLRLLGNGDSTQMVWVSFGAHMSYYAFSLYLSWVVEKSVRWRAGSGKKKRE